MKTLTILLTTTLFSASALAGNIYHGFEAGNTDLSGGQAYESEAMTGVQPGVGDSNRGYGTSDRMFQQGAGEMQDSTNWGVYNGFESPDL